MSNIRKIIIVILVITMFVFLGLGLNYMVKHYKKDEMNVNRDVDLKKMTNNIREAIENAEKNENLEQKQLPAIIKKENISLIGINKSIEVPINLDEVIKQLTERFNINVNLDEIPNKTALQLQQEYNNKVLGRWQ